MLVRVTVPLMDAQPTKPTILQDLPPSSLPEQLATAELDRSSRPTQSLHTFGAQIVEVEVDEETGQVVPTSIVAAHDVGCAINPQGVEGQIQGGVTQAIAHTLIEEVKYSANGDPQNAGFLDDKIPSILDLPLIEPVIVEEADEEGPFGAPCIGEPPILAMATAMATAIANAIEDAVGVRITSLPISAEKVLQALREQDRSGARGSR